MESPRKVSDCPVKERRIYYISYPSTIYVLDIEQYSPLET